MCICLFSKKLLIFMQQRVATRYRFGFLLELILPLVVNVNNFMVEMLFDLYVFCSWLCSETRNESRYKSGGDRYLSRIPALTEFYCLFLDQCTILIYLTLFAIQDEHLNKYLLIHCLFYNSKQHMLGFIQPWWWREHLKSKLECPIWLSRPASPLWRTQQ